MTWFDYNLGSLAHGNSLYTSITGDWTVPTVTQHTHGQDEYSSDWIGIGGGCVDANCTVGDNTLIQSGAEQDVDAQGRASYSAWWEVIPAPSLAISMTVAAGDHMHASIAELVPGRTPGRSRCRTSPAAPDVEADGFNACTWATSCAAP